MTYTISQFVCPDCGHIIPIPRKNKRRRENGHIKTLYCPWCGKRKRTMEYKDNQPIRNLNGDLIEY